MEIDKISRIRPVEADDYNFIFNAWLKSNRNARDNTYINNPTYFDNYKRILANLFRDTTTLVLCDINDSSQIFGFINIDANNNDINYLYIKYPYRKFGMAKHLLEEALQVLDTTRTIYITHYNSKIKKVIDKYDLIYNPYKLPTP